MGRIDEKVLEILCRNISLSLDQCLGSRSLRRGGSVVHRCVCVCVCVEGLRGGWQPWPTQGVKISSTANKVNKSFKRTRLLRKINCGCKQGICVGVCSCGNTQLMLHHQMNLPGQGSKGVESSPAPAPAAICSLTHRLCLLPLQSSQNFC